MRVERRSLLKAALAPAAIGSSSLALTSSAAQASDERIDVYAAQLMRASGTPGLALAFGREEEPSLELYLGTKNTDTTAPVDASTVFQAASISKMVFALGVRELSRRGGLLLDKPLVTYLRPEYLPEWDGMDTITAHHVLSHTSGLPNWLDENGDQGEPLTIVPGLFRYSGEAYFWLQLVVEKLTGKGLNAFMRDVVFEPAVMTSSAFVWDSSWADRMAWGHEQGRVSGDQGLRGVLGLVEPLAKEWAKPLTEWSHDEWLAAGARLSPETEHRKITFQNAAASLVTTATDLYRFMRFARSTRNDNADPALNMFAPTVRIAVGVDNWWGLGCSLERLPEGGMIAGHEGNNVIFRAYCGMKLETGETLVVLTNGDGGLGVYERLVRRLMGCDQLSFLANLNPNHSYLAHGDGA
ncbi:MAG: serine hydrolase domain-containing protein [Pseudomonadota bacterium]